MKTIAILFVAAALALGQTSPPAGKKSRKTVHKPVHAILHGFEVGLECVGAGAVFVLWMMGSVGSGS